MESEMIEQLRAEYNRLLETDVNEALPLIRQAAHWGDLESQKLACDIYNEGRLVTKDEKLAREYARLAALNGDVSSMVMLADALAAEKDYVSAVYFLRKAADANYSPALDRLAMAALTGKGMEKDPKLAKELIDKADSDDETVSRHKKMIDLANNK